MNILKSVLGFVMNPSNIVFIAVIVLMSFGWARSCSGYEDELTRMETNITAYEEQVASDLATIKVLNMTTAELSRSKDSINQKLLAAAEELKVKERRIQQLQYMKSRLRDTVAVYFTDTVLAENTDVDTTITLNPYTKFTISARYPSEICVVPDIVSEKSVVTHMQREFVNKPSKVFFVRWFQKKHWVSEVDIIESNPLIRSEKSRFVQVAQ